MNRTNLKSMVVLLAVTFLGCKETTKTVKTAPTKRPNIIFIMDDQHRWDALGIVNKQVITPTLDSLAKTGVFFNQAVSQVPMCVPSRNSIQFG
tara:strand:- start:1229 stop:1507 length:279 start_codon:yes stop_codon:yes gene_type:complete